MEEGHVTVDGTTHDVPRPFMVIATQNPIEQAGTYRLPEAQLDRFLMKTSVGYPDAESTEELLLGLGHPRPGRAGQARSPPPPRSARWPRSPARCTSTGPWSATSASSPRPPGCSRTCGSGCRARGCLALIRVAKTWAASQGRTAVVPGGHRTCSPSRCCATGCSWTPQAQFGGVAVDSVIERAARRRAAARPTAAERAGRGRRRCAARRGHVTAGRPRPCGRPARRPPCWCCGGRPGLAEFATIAWLSGLLPPRGAALRAAARAGPAATSVAALDPHRRGRGRRRPPRGHQPRRAPAAAPRRWTCPSATGWSPSGCRRLAPGREASGGLRRAGVPTRRAHRRPGAARAAADPLGLYRRAMPWAPPVELFVRPRMVGARGRRARDRPATSTACRATRSR